MDLTLPILALVAAAALYLVWHVVVSRHHIYIQKPSVAEQQPIENERVGNEKAYSSIESLPDFEWSTTPPIQLRPFKPKFHLTMGLENCPLSELLAVDNTYLNRINIRKQLMDSHPSETIQCTKACEPAVVELYQWLVATYLPTRFPKMYRLCSSSAIIPVVDPKSTAAGQHLHNIPADAYIPVLPTSATAALYTLGSTIDTDFLILLPSSKAPDGSPIYHLEAFVTCFPSGFSTRSKLSLPLAGIHAPVPGYGAKLEKSMDRFFAKMECGRAVRRANWSVTTNTALYSQGGNHMYEDGRTEERPVGEEEEGEGEERANGKTLDVQSSGLAAAIEEQKKGVELENCRLRCERQTLHRLPGTGALVFAFKTYQYRLADVKAEGSGPALAEAIAGLEKGSVPEIAFYKRGVVWGEKVREYLNS